MPLPFQSGICIPEFLFRGVSKPLGRVQHWVQGSRRPRASRLPGPRPLYKALFLYRAAQQNVSALSTANRLRSMSSIGNAPRASSVPGEFSQALPIELYALYANTRRNSHRVIILILMTPLDFAVVLLPAFAALWLFKRQSRFRHEHYFYFGQILDGSDDSQASLFGILYRILIPAFGGTVAALLSWSLSCAHRPEFYGIMTGGTIAFLVVWPSIFNQNPAVVLHYRDRLKYLWLMRLMFAALYTGLGFCGGVVVKVFLLAAFRAGRMPMPSWFDGKSLFTNLLSTAISTCVLVLIGWAYKMFQGLTKKG